MSYQSEAALEEELIKNLEILDYERIHIHDTDELIKNLKVQLEKLNKTTFTDNEFNRILLFLDKGAVYDKAEKLRDKYELTRDDGTQDYIKFLDNHWCKNIFQVTNQITVQGTYKNRYDVTLLINGLPLIQIELKRRGIELKQAFNQIIRYRKHSYKNLFGYIQIFIISNGVNTKYFANNKELNYKYTFFWKDFQNHNITNLKEFTERFLDKFQLHKMITKYIVLSRSTKTITVLRAYQYYAVERILDKTLHSKENGYIWHTTGSGKTLTSFKASQLLSEKKEIDKVIFIVDRRDLDNQTLDEFNKYGNNSIDGTYNTKKLIRQLNGTDKLIITTIQKLSYAVKNKSKKLERIKDNKMVLMFDECHRSQFGEMHKVITKYFTNIQYFGFTGTPILAENKNQLGKTTHSIFGECLHKYLIVDAIADENVLGFSVDYVGKYIGKLKKDVAVEKIDIREFLESKKRIEKIVDYIIENHNRKTYNKEFTSILAVESIDVLNKYYQIFKEKDHDLKIATIYTFAQNPEIEDYETQPRDLLEDEIRDYNEMFKTNFSTDTFQMYYQDISKKSKNKQIDILLVVNMFLTGFDNKYLNTLYVDKNLVYHGLLQAYSRTNRICNEKKAYGNIVCFRNLKKQTDDAITLFSNEHAISTVLMKPYNSYINEFNDIVDMLYDKIKNMDELNDNKNPEIQENFVKIFREMIRILNKLKTFTEFKFEDLKISEQDFEDYKSKYLDLYDKQKDPTTADSILDDIDFETELLRRDDINETYILELLKQLDPESPSFIKEKEFILEIMGKDEELRSKMELIEKFIQRNMIETNTNINTEEKLEEFMDEERAQAINKLIKDEDLKKEPIKNIIQDYEFSGKIKQSNVKESFNKPLKLKERRTKTQQITQKIKELINVFAW